jgi:hypothetical protein
VSDTHRRCGKSASEREERLQRLKFRKKYLKKTPGIASSRPLRLVVRLSSSAASKRGLSGPATERIPLYPFVKPHESKRYGSPVRTERGSHTVATNAFPQANKVRFRKPGENSGTGQASYFDEGSRFSAQWGSASDADNLQPLKLRRGPKKAANRKSSDEAESDDSLHT